MDLGFPDSVNIVETLPRDGFQSMERFMETDKKVEIIDKLSETGVGAIEYTSFTHPKAVPNLRDAETVAQNIQRREEVTYRALVPNTVGMNRAVAAGVDAVNALVVVSDSYRQKNQGMTLSENLREVEGIVDIANDHGISVEAGIGTSFFCPYEGYIQPERTIEIVSEVLDAGVDQVTLATTMGMAVPSQIGKIFSDLGKKWPNIDWGLHLHNTNGMSLANAIVAMQTGVRRFDTALCGLGGGTALPESLTGVGNTPTEDMVNMLRQMTIETGVTFDTLKTTAQYVDSHVETDSRSYVLRGGIPEVILSESVDEI